MTITIDCPACRKSLTLDAAFAGGRIACPQCGQSIEVPKHGATSEPMAPIEIGPASLLPPPPAAPRRNHDDWDPPPREVARRDSSHRDPRDRDWERGDRDPRDRARDSRDRDWDRRDRDPRDRDDIRRRGDPYRRLEPHRGQTVLTLGILGFFFLVTAIIALVFAAEDLRKMDQGIMDDEGRSATKAGQTCGIIALIISGVWILLVGILVCAGIASTRR